MQDTKKTFFLKESIASQREEGENSRSRLIDKIRNTMECWMLDVWQTTMRFGPEPGDGDDSEGKT